MTGFSNIGRASGFAGIGANGQPEGDLTGSYPNPTVVGLQTQPIDPRAPANGDTLIYNGGEWIPTPAPTATTYFQGIWDANTNTPDIENFPGLSDGFVWIVSVAGNTNLGGITNWLVGDYAVYSGGNWYKLSNSSFGWGLTGNNGTNPTVNYVGTADEKDFVIKANASESLRLYWTGGSRLSGSVLISDTLTVTNNITGSNAKLIGDLEVCGGDITTKSAIFNLLNGATTRINMGNSAASNWISGSTKFPQGLSGSLTRLIDGKSYLVSNSNINIVTQSNGSVKIHAYASGNDTHVQFNDGGFFAGDSGLTYNKTTDELTIAGDINVNGGDIKSTALTFNLLNSTVTNLNLGGAATTVEIGSNVGNTNVNNSLIVDGNTTLGDNSSDTVTVNGTTTFQGVGVTSTFVGDIAVNGGDITSTSPTFNLLNTGVTTLNLAGGATSAINVGNAAATNTVRGSTKFPQGLSGSLTKLTDGTSAFVQGVGILVTSASNGAVTVTLSNTGSAGTYGTASAVPVFSTNAQGRVTSVTNTAIAINASQVTAGTFPSTVSVQNIYQNVTSQVSGGSTPLAYGEVIYFTTSGGSAVNPAVNRASAASATTAATTIGLVSSTTIPNGTTGQIITKGVLVGNPLGTPPYLNTNGFTQGDLLYVDPTTPGALTNVKPSYPNFAIPVGIVIVKNQYTGAIYVDPSVGYNAADPVKIPAASSKRTEPAGATTSILTTWFNGPPAVSYLALDFSGPGNVTLSAGPIQTQTTADYGRILWIHNVSTKTITFNAGGTTYLSGGVNLVLQPNGLVQFMWSFVGGGAGRWLQMTPAIIVS